MYYIKLNVMRRSEETGCLQRNLISLKLKLNNSFSVRKNKFTGHVTAGRLTIFNKNTGYQKTLGFA